jgi:hypothetical protein
MPDPYDPHAARRALDAVAAPDLWDEAQRRAADGSVVALDSPTDGASRPGRWGTVGAVAAVAILAIGTTAVLLDDDTDAVVDTAPLTTVDPGPGTGTTVVGDACTVGISGDPVVMDPGPADPPLFDLSGQPEGQLVAHTMLGSQVAELHVPGLVLDDLTGERVEEVGLARGTAQLWLREDLVQVRWFPGRTEEEPCESFTVTVAGGGEDANRHAAVDFAERILLPSDLGDLGELGGAALERTAWRLDSVTVGDATIDGNGAGFSILDGEATWTDGCNHLSAPYTLPSRTELLLGEVETTLVGCDPDPVHEAIAAVMAPGAVEVAFGSGVEALFLSRDDTTLALVPAEGDAGPAVTTSTTAQAAESRVGTTRAYDG